MNIFNTIDNYIRTGRLTHCYIFYADKNVDIEQYVLYFINKISSKPIKEFSYETKYQDLSLVNFDETKTASKDLLVQAFKRLENVSSDENGKFLVIKDLDKMSSNSLNFILKSIEEPSPNSYIFITTRNLKRLPKTIVSRGALLKVPNYFSEKELKKINKIVVDEIFKDFVINLFFSFDKVALYIKQIKMEDIKNALIALVDSVNNKFKIASYILQHMTYANFYNISQTLIFLLQEKTLKKTKFYQLHANEFDLINFEIQKINKIIEIVLNFVEKMNNYGNFYLQRQTLIIELMRYYE